MSAESPYKPPQDEVPAPSNIGTALRAVLALLAVVGLAVAYLTRQLWIAWFTDDPTIAWIVGVGGAGAFMTWLRWPRFRKGPKRVRPPRRLRNRYR